MMAFWYHVFMDKYPVSFDINMFFYFNVGGAQTVYTYFDLYDFTDDLDITLFKYNGVLNEYENIATAQEEGSSDEILFKGLVPGDYILEILHTNQKLCPTALLYELSLYVVKEHFMYLS